LVYSAVEATLLLITINERITDSWLCEANCVVVAYKLLGKQNYLFEPDPTGTFTIPRSFSLSKNPNLNRVEYN